MPYTNINGQIVPQAAPPVDSSTIAPLNQPLPASAPTDAIFSPPVPSLDAIWQDGGGYGTGSETGDNFLASVLTLPQMHGQGATPAYNPDNPPFDLTTAIGNNQDQVASTPTETLHGRLDSISQNVMQQSLTRYVAAMQNVYAAQQDQQLVQDTKQTTKAVKAVVAEGDPTAILATNAGMMMGQMKNRNDVERFNVIAKTAIFNQYVEQHLSHGFWSSAKELVTDMAVPTSIRDLAGGLTPNRLVQMAKDFRNQMPEDQVKNLPGILKYLEGVSSNKYIFEENAKPFLDSEDINQVWRTLGLDVVTTASMLPLAKIVKMARLSTTAIRLTREAGALDQSGSLVAEAAADTSGKAAEIAGTDQITAGASAQPFGGEAAIPTITNGVNVAAQRKLESWLGPVRMYLNRLISGANKDYILRGALLPQERDAFQEKLLNTYAGQAKIVAEDQNGFQMRVRMDQATAEDGNVFTPIEYKVIRYQKNNIGTLDTLEYSLANPLTSSADTIMNQLINGAPVDIASKIEYTQKQVLGLFQAAGKQVFQGMGKADRAQINSLLEHGEAQGIDRFSTADLITGIQTKDGVIRLSSADQVARYHAARDMMDTHFYLNNQILRRELLFNGYDSSITVNNYLGKMKNFVKRGQGLSEMPSGVKEIYDMRVGKVVPVDDVKDINEAVKAGKLHILETKLPIEYSQGRTVTRVLATNFHIRPMSDQVLNKVAGYFGPLMYKNIFHVAVQGTTDFVDGVATPAQKVVRAFSSKAEAETFRTLPENAGKDIKIIAGREFSNPASGLPQELKDEFQTKVFGGFTTSQRNPTRLAFGLKGTTAETASAIESMEAAIGNVSERLPMNDYKLGWINRLVNSGAKFDPALGRRLATDWTSAIGGGKELAGLRYAQTWMKGIFNIKTAEERGFQQLMYHVGSWFDNQTLSKFTLGTSQHLRNWAMNLGASDVYGTARTMAFHALLGWLNPRQLFVQAAGAQAAFFVNPTKAAFLLPRYMALRAVMYDDLKASSGMVREAISGATKFMGKDQWEDLVDAYRRSGVRDSIRTTADYDASIKGFGMTRRMIARAADNGLFFLRESELFNRSYNWLWAHSRFMDGKAAGYRLTLADEEKITSESLRISTNLMKANRAGFQKGFWSIPLQFQQVSSKFIGNMLYGMKSGRGNWTAAEKTKIFLGGMALFGAAEVPYGNWAAKHIVNWAKDDGDYGLGVKDPDAVHAITGGFTDYLLDKISGTNATIASSLSYAGNFSDLVANFTQANSNFTRAALAAVGSVGDRTLTAAATVGNLVRADITTGHYDAETWEEILSTMATPISSWNNIAKANLWARTKQMVTASGDNIKPLDPEGMDAPLLLLQRLGFSQSEFQNLHDLKQVQQDAEQQIKDAQQAWIKIVLRVTNEPYYQTARGMEVAEAQIGLVQSGLTQEQRAELSKRMHTYLSNPTNEIVKQNLKMLKLRPELEGNLPGAELNTIELPRNQ